MTESAPRASDQRAATGTLRSRAALGTTLGKRTLPKRRTPPINASSGEPAKRANSLRPAWLRSRPSVQQPQPSSAASSAAREKVSISSAQPSPQTAQSTTRRGRIDCLQVRARPRARVCRRLREPVQVPRASQGRASTSQSARKPPSRLGCRKVPIPRCQRSPAGPKTTSAPGVRAATIGGQPGNSEPSDADDCATS